MRTCDGVGPLRPYGVTSSGGEARIGYRHDAREHLPSHVMALTPDAVVAERAAKQAGTFSHQQASAARFSAKAIRHRLATGQWVRLHPRVYALKGAPPTLERRLWAAFLACPDGSAVARESALAVFGMKRPRSGRPRLTIPPHARAPKGIDVRRSMLEPRDRTTRQRLPCTTLARTIVDMAADLSPDELAELLDEAITDLNLNLDKLHETVHRVCGRGKAGSRIMKLLADDRKPGDPVPASKLERATLALLEQAGYTVVLQHRPSWREGVPSGVVDFYIPELKLIVEADGRRWHAREAAWELDRERDLDAVAHGFRTARITWLMITTRPAWTLERLVMAGSAAA